MVSNISPQDVALIDEYCHYLEHQMNRAHHTIRSYRADLQGLASDMAPTPLTDGTPVTIFRSMTLEDLRGGLAQLSRHGIGRTTVARTTTAVRQFMSWQVRRGVRQETPAARLVAGKTPSPLPATLSPPQMSEALESLQAAPPGQAVR